MEDLKKSLEMLREARSVYKNMLLTIREHVEGKFSKRNDQVLHLYDAGFTKEEIAEVLGVSEVNVYARLKDLGKVKFS